MLDLDALEAKAKAAKTPMSSGFAGMLSDAAIEFIAAANPDSILELIRELSEARASRAEMLARLQEEAKLHVNFMLGEHAKVVTERDEARAAVAAEREACAETAKRVAVEVSGTSLWPETVALRIESAIRARGAKGGE